MSQLFPLSLEIMDIEPFNSEITEGYDAYEWPGGYDSLEGEKIKYNSEAMNILVLMINPGFIVRCPVDLEALDLKENQRVKIVMCGRQIACVLNPENKRYVLFNAALRKKYIMPRAMAGINMALISALSGYILSLIFQHQQSSWGETIMKSGAGTLFMASILYSIYYYTNDTYAHVKLKRYLKKIV